MINGGLTLTHWTSSHFEYDQKRFQMESGALGQMASRLWCRAFFGFAPSITLTRFMANEKHKCARRRCDRMTGARFCRSCAQLVRYLKPTGLDRHGRCLAKFMLDDLLSNQLEVCLVPGRDWQPGQASNKIRAVQTENAEWYRRFCRMYKSARKYKGTHFKTAIKRRETVKALEGIVDRRSGGTIYAERLEEFIKSEAKKARRRRKVNRRKFDAVLNSFATAPVLNL